MLKRHSSKIPLSTLLNQRPALREIAVRYAQRVYTNRGVPIETLARRLDIEPLDLCSYGTHIGEWRLPHYATLTHIISESVIRNYS